MTDTIIKEPAMDIKEIMKHAKHRYPMLLVDRVISIADDEVVAIKNVSINEPFFVGHFPGEPVMPGVLTVEAVAQVSGILALKSLQADNSMSLTYYLASIQSAKFRKPITPGDTMVITVKKTKSRSSLWRFEGVVTVDGIVAAEVELTNFIAPPPSSSQ